MKVFLLGLDGMTLKIIEPYIEAGLLPNFKKLKGEGAWGTLQSTIPPITGPGWVSLTTGKNAGKHGVFEFRKRNGYKTELLTRNNSETAEPLWTTLKRNGKKVVLINIPFTYPPDEVDGVLISGMTTPSTHADFVYPREVKDELFELIPDYQIDAGGREFILSGDKNELLKQAFKITRDRRKLMQHYLDNREWDLFFITFVATDRLQHFMWEEIIAQDARCVEFYQLLDEILGEALDRVDNETALLVVSDHGFRASRKSFCINNFLRNEGFLTTRDKSGTERAMSKVNLAGLVGALYMLGKRVGLLRLKKYVPLPLLKRVKETFLAAGMTEDKIDWENTRVFSLLWYAVDINLRGREARGIVDEKDYDDLCKKVEEALLNVRDPETGDGIIRKVYRGKDLYATNYENSIPDLVVDMSDGYAIRNDLGENIVDDVKVGKTYITGNHDLDGIMMGCGDVINPTNLDASIYDVCPTILYLMGLPIPDDVDGRVLTEMITSEFTSTNEQKTEKVTKKGSSRGSTTQEEAEELEKRLRDLGYLG
ncbi:MAG: alkaline phosphatase family protein [Candidatus Krumholzibacteriia bacterium]